MMRLKPWQWGVLASPVVLAIGFVLAAAASQIAQWHLNWIWGVFIVVFVGWRWLLVKWVRPEANLVEQVIEQAQLSQQLAETREEGTVLPSAIAANQAAEASLVAILAESQSDRPLWEDWPLFWQRCQEVTVAVARAYHPEVKYPLLNIFIPQAYGLIRGTVDDVDRWMQQVAPALNQVTVAQAYQAYETYCKLEPSARKLWQVWNWAQWVLNPAAALARRASQRYGDLANQQLLANFSQMIREIALRNLFRQAAALYGGADLPATFAPKAAQRLSVQTQTLREILAQAEPVEAVEQKPLGILLVGRTGAGKSSTINTLFQTDRAAVDVLPSTDRVGSYHWQHPSGERLTLWDSPGYEQVGRPELREQVLDCAREADLLLLVLPALDPALQMDVDFLKDMSAEVADLPCIALVTQVDRLRPLREWSPPYDWQAGDRPKERAIREAIAYRSERLGDLCRAILPWVTRDASTGRQAWNEVEIAMTILEAVDPAKQLRLARFLGSLDARAVAAAQIVDRYTWQMSTTQGLTALLKSPVLGFISTLSTGSPALAHLLAEQIPVEQLPVAIGKLQMAYDLHSLLGETPTKSVPFDLLALWPLLLENPGPADRNAWAFGHTLVEYWAQGLSLDQLRQRFADYLERSQSQGSALTR